MIKYARVPAANFETNYEIMQVLEKVQNTLQAQAPLMNANVTPTKAYHNLGLSPFKTPNRSSIISGVPYA